MTRVGCACRWLHPLKAWSLHHGGVVPLVAIIKNAIVVELCDMTFRVVVSVLVKHRLMLNFKKLLNDNQTGLNSRVF